MNKKINSSGSLIGVLNLTIDKAPTKPNDKASEDLTTAMIIVIINVNKIKFEEIFSLSEIVFQNFI